MNIAGTSVLLRPLDLGDAHALHSLRSKDRAFLEPWEPRRSESFWTLEGQCRVIEGDIRAAAEDCAYAFGIFTTDNRRLVGRVVLGNVVRASWQNATLGYFVTREANGRGLATEAVRLAVSFAFNTALLHRVQAAAMPRNAASVRVLEKARFVREGLARRYLEINGVWEDHLVYAVTAEDWTG